MAISNSYFSGNTAGKDGGGIYALTGGSVTITGSYFSDNVAKSSSGNGGALYVYANSGVFMTDGHFSGNKAGSTSGNGGAVYVQGGNTTMTDCSFSDNVAGSQGGAISTNQFGNVTVGSTTFVNNTARIGGGGAIYTGGRYANISLTSNTFSYNTAASCGAVDIDESYRYRVDLIGNIFTHNRAVGKVAGINGGGAICIRNASILVRNNNFINNSAAGDAGVLQVDDSDITIEGSKFSNNTAGGNGGVLHNYFYPTSYTVTNSSFTNNQAGNGGVMYVGRNGSQVKISAGTFAFNKADDRGGVIAIAGSTLYINGANICKKNSAKLGSVVSACNSKVTISNPNLPAKPDPVYSFCSLYNCPN